MKPCACAKATGSQMRSKIRSRSVAIANLLEALGQRPTPDTLHDVEEAAVGEPASVVNRDDAWVFEPGEDAGFASQPAFEVHAGERVRDLDRDLAAELLVDSEEDRSHAAAADFFDDRVAAGLELRPPAQRPEAGHRRVRQSARLRAHSTSSPKRSRASRRNSWSLPHNPRSASSARSRKRRRTCARLFVTCAGVRSNSAASCA